ncbi:hypothetical protein HK101_007448 [Irineochytrium annulatum]|nr:hypothetical protein HK101_007448 [Irineochytrium annulatum]
METDDTPPSPLRASARFTAKEKGKSVILPTQSGSEDYMPWVEKYRPSQLDELISHKDIIATVTRFIDENKLPHLLFYGPPGTGKTSTILACAHDRGIDVVREQIKNFASTKKIFSSGFKLIILDEADAMTQVAQNALRRIVEKYTSNVRFCIICNYVSKIIPALQSRCTRFRFAPLKEDQIEKRLAHVVESESVVLKDDGKKALLRLSKGDMRKALNILQAVHAAYDCADEVNVYTCVGSPLPGDITRIMDWLMNDEFDNAYRNINALKTEKGLALADILADLHTHFSSFDVLPHVRALILSKLAEIDTDEDLDLIEPVSPIPELDETIDYSLVYALHTFVANLEGQVCVLKGDSLELLDDSNSYWWLVKCIKTDEIGYIPAENVETPFERLARLNRIRNVQLASINAQDAEEGDKVPAPQRRGITISETPEVFDFYDEDDEGEEGDLEDEEMEEEGAMSPTDAQQTASGPQRSKERASMSLGQNFLKKLLGRNSLGRKEKGISTSAPGRGPRSPEKPTPRSNNDSATAVSAGDEPQQGVSQIAPVKEPEPINVLRIYAGNVDLKATFKSVALTKDMTVTQLVEVVLKRFRVPGASPNEYYLSLLHLDSQEKRLTESDNMIGVLEGLRHKQLPGVSAKAVNNSGRVSNVHMNDDKIIKVIINKKLNLFEKNYHLIRIYMDEDSDGSGKVRTYKTIGVNSKAKISDIIEIALKKFKIVPDANFVYSLTSVFKGIAPETVRLADESVLDILMMAKGSPEDIDFILRKEWVGEGSMPRMATDVSASSQQQNADILQHKPAFLEDLPMSPSQGSFMNNGSGSPDSNGSYNDRASLNTPNVMSPLSKEIAEGTTSYTDSSTLNSTSIAQPAWSPPSPPDEKELTKPAPRYVPPRKGSLSDASIPRLPLDYAGPPGIEEADERTYLDGVAPAPSVLSSQNSSAIKASFDFMEEYLEEILKETKDPARMEALETALGKTSSDAAGRGLHSAQGSDASLNTYSDSGLSQMLKSQKPDLDARRPSQDSLSTPLSPTPRNRSLSNATYLRDMYDDIEKDIEKTLKTSGPDTSNAAGKSTVTESSRPSVPAIVTVDNPLTNPFPTPLSARLDSQDQTSAVDRFREAEVMLNAMQRDLDSLLASAVNAFQVTETIFAK